MIDIMMRYLCGVLLLTISGTLLHAAGDTLFLSVSDCYYYANRNNFKMQISQEQFFLSERTQRLARTQHLGNISITGRYQYTNNPFQLFDESLFMPVVPFWAIDREEMDLSDAVMENPLYHGIVTNPATGEPFTDSDGNPIFFLYSYLPEDHLEFGHTHNFLFGPGIIQPVYLGGRIRSINKIADAGLEIARSRRNIETSDAYYEIQKTYWTIVDLQEKEKLAEKYLNFLENLITDLENIHEEGIITYHDVLAAKIKHNEVKLNQIKIRNGLELSKSFLRHLTGIDSGTPLFLTDKADNIPLLPDTFHAKESAINNREEINILDQGREIALANYNMARARFFPNISFSANYLFINPNPYAGFRKEFGHDYTLGVNVHIPVYSWGERVHALKSAEHLIRISEIKKQEAASLIELEVQQMWFEYKEALEVYALKKSALKLADKNKNLYIDKFDQGMITSSDLLEAATLRHQAYSDLIEAKTKLKIIETDYKRKTGILK